MESSLNTEECRQKIVAQKKLLKLSYEDIARKSKVARMTVFNVIKGNGRPRKKTLQALCSTLKIDIGGVKSEVKLARHTAPKKRGRPRDKDIITATFGPMKPHLEKAVVELYREIRRSRKSR